MARAGLRKINRYSEEFKATAVRLSDLPEVLIQDVAAGLRTSGKYGLFVWHPVYFSGIGEFVWIG